ncbi:MAG: hypothetical protein ACREHV_11605 [Rhizomicrobium sp.]
MSRSVRAAAANVIGHRRLTARAAIERLSAIGVEFPVKQHASGVRGEGYEHRQQFLYSMALRDDGGGMLRS